MNHSKAPEIPDLQPVPDGGLEVITTHVNADFDALASMIAAGKLYPDATMIFPGSQERNMRNFFIQSVIYLFNVARVKDVDLSRVKRLILVDTRHARRIGPLEKILENEDLEIHIYDHHPESGGELRGQMEVLAKVGANSTLMTEILLAKAVELSPEEATVLALGIYEDTGAFTYQSTTVRDYRAAAELLEMGADLGVVAEMITRELTVDQVGLLNELLTSSKSHLINGVELTIAQATTEHYVEEMAVLVQKIMDIKGIDVMFALAVMEGRIYFVARSRLPQVNVGDVAAQLGGGGHPSAAAASLKNITLPQAEAKLLSVLAQTLEPMRTARDIMVKPVISVRPGSSLAKARELFVRYDINALLVIEPETGTILGYISRQNVSKALHHGLPDYPVDEFMTVEFGVVQPEATFADIQNLIVSQKQRLVPVVEKGKTVGVITRTDLLNILTSETNVPGSLVEEQMDARTGRTKKIISLMREKLPRKLIDLLAEIGRTADELGFRAYAVGGFVRDLLLRHKNLDIDIVIEGDIVAFTRAFCRNRPKVRVRRHDKFKTAVLIFPDGFKIDVTTARLEYYEHPGALPVVEGGSIQLDLYRRDFTINTLAVSLGPKDFGTVIDYFRGLKDIKEGYIRVLHNLSFVEDPTRVFRAVRFEQRFGFRIGKLTLSLINNAVKHGFFKKLSGKRLIGEIRLLLQEKEPAAAVERMDELNLLQFVHPKIRFDLKIKALFDRITKVGDWFDLSPLTDEFQIWLLYFLGLIDGLTSDEALECSRRLALLKRERSIVVDEKPQADKSLEWLARQRNIQPSQVYFILAPFSIEAVLFMMAKTTNKSTARTLADYLTNLRNVRPELNGEDLKKMGFTPGPVFRTILDEVLAARLNGLVHSKTEEEELVRENHQPPQA